VDKALNYKSASFKEDFKKIGYLDVYFDNVGGEILDMALGRLNKNARIVLCGKSIAYGSSIFYNLKSLYNRCYLAVQYVRTCVFSHAG
jgi:NADPH-dependent curcumin reductase CurA